MTQEKIKLLIEADTKPFRDAVRQIKQEVKSTTDQVKKQISEMKEPFAEIAMMNLSQGINSNIDAINQECAGMLHFRDMMNQLGDAYNSFMEMRSLLLSQAHMLKEVFNDLSNTKTTMMEALKKVYTEFQVFFMGLSEGSGFMTSLSAAFGTTAASVMAAVGVIAAVTAAVVYLWQTSEEFRQIIEETVNTIGSLLSDIYLNVIEPLFSFLLDVFQTVLVPMAVFLADAFVTAVDFVITVLLSLWNDVFAPIASFLVEVLAIALQGIIDIWNAWKPAIEMLSETMSYIWNDILIPIADWIKEVLLSVFASWGETINNLIPGITLMFQGLIDFFTGIFTLDIERVLGGIQTMFEGFDEFLNGIFKTDWVNAFGSFGNIINAFFAIVSDMWQSIKMIFNGMIDFIGGVFSGDWERVWQGVVNIFSGIFQGIGSLIKAPINGVIEIVNWAIDKINSISIDVPDWVPGIGGEHFGLNIDKIPYLAKGGIVTSPLLSVIGEAGKEAVLPLENNTGWIALLASQLNSYGTSDQSIIIALLKQLIDAVERKELSIGDREIGEANQRYHERRGFSFGTV